MSSTNRGAERNKEDYYVTPHWLVREFLESIDYGGPKCKTILDLGERILDPSAGGCEKYEMSYPTVLNQFNFDVETWDIREDSRAARTGVDFLQAEGKGEYDTVITNPSFILATQFVEKGLEHVRERGLVIMLQRLNWLGSIKRFEFWGKQPLQSVFVHHKRPGFDPENPNKTDSIEYAHFVFRKGYNNLFAPNLYII
ncbi:SAM-dependent methyltransferase [Pseudoalteromonas luteoviolacea]|uniref:SAM-dependent methyltransferase n=1 Tax=Pseudoalteromonas luteoviolacea TaxID=43657 RepID=UPI001F28F7AA|nr:SAM-dependent methyltransferase [Pseudoalteromonas luteoviolacea]MCF6442332.1 SAM-dependent methyltransferase [Pseudoalteromonas luteoviolacea]